MKYLILMFLSLNAYAADTVIGDAASDMFVIRTSPNEEPVWHPVVYTLLVKCQGDKEARVLKSLKVCRMIGHKFDETTRQLEVTYETGRTDSATVSPCETAETSRRRVTRKNLAQECAKK